MTDGPAVSVVIPAYNAAWCIGRAVESVLGQTFLDFELIVVNDGSSDATATVLTDYGPALRVIEQVNGGLSNARNTGLCAARGRYVAFLDADDWWLPPKLERQVALLDNRPELAFCSTAARLEDVDGQPLGAWSCRGTDLSPLEAIFAVNAFVAGSGSAVMARRQVFEQVGRFDESLRSLEDIDMWMRLASAGGYACVGEPLAVILKRPGSMSGNLGVMRDAALAVMRKNRHLLPPEKRGGFWRHAIAGVLSDYAKWAWRAGQRRQALIDIGTAFRLAPLSRGRLLLGLLAGMLLNRSL